VKILIDKRQDPFWSILSKSLIVMQKRILVRSKEDPRQKSIHRKLYPLM